MINYLNASSTFSILILGVFFSCTIQAQVPQLSTSNTDDATSIELELLFPIARQIGGSLLVLEVAPDLGDPLMASFPDLGTVAQVHPDSSDSGHWVIHLPEVLGQRQLLEMNLHFSSEHGLSSRNAEDGGIVIVEVVEGYRIGQDPETIALWPNPCSGQLHVSTTIPLSKVEVKRPGGAVLRCFNAFSGGSINLAGVDSGLLVLKATGTQGQTFFKLFLHQ